MFVVKASGKREEFQKEKIKNTCLRAGANKKIAGEIAEAVEKKAYDGISTKEVLQITLALLDKYSPPIAAKYDLKGAIMRLGPAGYEFEQLVAELLKEYGFKTQWHIMVQGMCVQHEVDVIAEKEKTFMIECKYHNSSGTYTGIKDALYTYARFLDLQEGFLAKKCQKFDQPWLFCNTKFSQDVLHYASCKHMLLTGWNFPNRQTTKGLPAVPSLQKLLEDKKLYPITVLRRLDRFSQERLAQAGLLFCKDLLSKSFEELRKLTNIKPTQLKLFIEEAEKICE